MHNTVLLLFFLSVAVPISLTDIKAMRIPNYLVIAGGILVILGCINMNVTLCMQRLSNCFFGALILFLQFLAIYIICKNKLGFGDVKYSAVCGAFCGFPYVFSAGIIAAGSALIYFALLKLSGKQIKEMKIPFAPFMSIGVLLILIYKLIFL